MSESRQPSLMPGSRAGRDHLVTIADIAAEAGVSVPTVSKVLNGRKGVSPDTRRRIEQLLAEHGYERRRTKKGSGLVDFVITDLETQWATSLLRGAQSEAAHLGVDLVVTTTHGQPVGTPDWLDRLSERGSDGVVLVVSRLLPAAREELARLRTPVVLVDPVGVGDPSMANVAATDWSGGRDAADHLIELGHRRIAMITGPIDQACHQDRLDGYRSALQRAGIAFDETLVRFGDSLVGGGLEHGRALLRGANRPTAIISGSDEQAYGVYRAASECGLAIPDDLSVVGFDDVELCQWVSPQLTTIHQPLLEMASVATRMVVDMSREERASARRVELATSIVVRESTAAPRT